MKPAHAQRVPMSGFFSHGCSGLRTHICHAPSSKAPPKLMKPSQKCARTSRLLFNTAESPRTVSVCHLEESRFIDHPDVRPHALMSRAAELVAWHQMVAGLREGTLEGGDITGFDHRIDIRVRDQESMYDIRAGRAKCDGRIGRNQQALWRERILLRDNSHGHRPIRFNRAAQVALNEFTAYVERFRPYGLHSGWRHHGPMQPGEDRHGDQHAENDYYKQRPLALDARGHVSGSMGRVFSAHWITPRGRNTR